VIEVKSSKLDQEWHRVGSATVRVVEERAAIYFDMVDVDGTNARVRVEDGSPQALMDITAVRITAIVKSDERIVYDAPRQETAGSSLDIEKTVRDGKFRWVNRHSSSAYSGDGTGVIRDDAGEDRPMEETAGKLREKAEGMREGVSLTLPWVDVTYHVGERISDIDGRGIGFSSKPGDAPSYPKIGSVVYDFLGQETVLYLWPARS